MTKNYGLTQNTIMAFALFLLTLTFSNSSFAQKMSAEEIVAKHLDSIGTKENRAKQQNITATGDATFKQGSQEGIPGAGKIVLASEGSKLLYAMTFEIQAYQLEKITFDGKTLDVAFTRPSLRSSFGEYILSYNEIIREGLLGGVLRNGWALKDLDSRNAKVSFDGIKKIDGKEVYALSYSPKKGTGLVIKLFFDKDTFRHVRTEYRRTISAQMGANPNLSAQQLESYENMTEDFADFKTENGITLPRSYKTFIFLQRGKTSREYYYTANLTDFYYNQKLDPNTFARVAVSQK